ncbi:ABC transporter permease [Lachnospiraceae bacterium OttesenSCG-928-D06]|nr:ABC transporter permease [Lachnospiraceae bacterium OttesenSCG-928-D06]
MKISTLLYTIQQGIRNIFRNKLFSLASVATIAACLFLFGIFYAIVANFQSIVRSAQEVVSLTVFFEDGTSEERMQEIGEMIARRLEVSELHFISDEEAWEDMKSSYPPEFAEGFLKNPLEGLSNYEVYLSDVSMQSSLVTYLESITEVKSVKRSDVTATMLSGANQLIGMVSLGIILILLGVSIFLISNTVTIGISVRSEEINIMKYIGATDFFVRAPFVLEGMIIGLIGAAIPLGLIHGLYNYAIEYIVERFDMLSQLLAFLPADAILQFLTPISLGVGVGIGFIGSFTTVRKHLQV